jgi:cleavage and polyadenylation specificity factor subunit 2
MASLEAGFSHDIFVEWGNDVKNLVLFTERGQVYSLEEKGHVSCIYVL